MNVTLVAEERSLLGVEAVLDAEGITYGRSAYSTPVLVDLIEAERVVDGTVDPASLDGRRIVVLAGGKIGTEAAEMICAEPFPRLQAGTVARFVSDDLPSAMADVLEASGFDSADVPLSGLVVTAGDSPADKVHFDSDTVRRPLITRRGRVVVVMADLGASMLDLLTETYAEVAQEAQELSGPLAALYRLMPFGLRLKAYAVLWRRLRRRVEARPGFKTRFPVDPAGWLVHSLIVHAIEISAPSMPRIWRWPLAKPYALCLTHDIEPREYAYGTGLPRLLDVLAKEGVPASVSIVARPGFDLPEATIVRISQEGHEVISHGLHHDGMFNQGETPERVRRVRESREILGEMIGSEVSSFRTPWLQRTRDIVAVLEESGIRTDSSFVDSDTSMKKAWHGLGISYNYPHRLISRDGSERRSEILELPIAGPQDMELVFAGFGIKRATDALLEKLRWSRSIGAAHTVIVHAGVYGDSDSEMRESLLGALVEEAKKGDVWIARMSDVREWWDSRSALSADMLESEGGSVVVAVANGGETTVADAWLDLGADGEVGPVTLDGDEVQTKVVSGRVLAPVGTLEPGWEVLVRYSVPGKVSL